MSSREKSSFEVRKKQILESNKKDKDKAKLMINLGIEAAKQGNANDAMSAYMIATRLDDKSYSAWLNLAAVEEYLEMTHDALVNYSNAAKLPDDKYNKGQAARKAEELSWKWTQEKAEFALKQAKIIPEKEPPPRARPNVSHNDSLASVKRMFRLSLEEREKLNERHEFSALVFDELFAHEAKGEGREKIVEMNEEMWYRFVHELISRGRPDAAAENMIFCVKENPKRVEYWRELIDLLKGINDSGMLKAAEEACLRVSAGEQIEFRTWAELHVSPPK
jgi:tetratricopeptide (TPR) repeat protein